MSNSIKNKGRKHTDESRKNMSESHKGIKPSQESINKRLLKVIGRKMSQESINKIISKNTGQKRSDETKRKQSESAKHRNFSKESKLEMSNKMSELKKKPRKQYKLISPNNIEYIFDGLKMVFKFTKDNNLSINLLKDFFNKGKVISKSKYSKNSENWEFILLKKI